MAAIPKSQRLVELPFSFQHLSIVEGVRAATAREPGKTAYRHGNATRTYQQLLDRVDQITACFIGDLGLGTGDHGAIVARNSIEFMEIVLGASQAGVALATVNPKLLPAEIVAICDDARARVLFIDAVTAEALRDCDFASVERIIVIDNDLEDWLAKARPISERPTVKEWDTFTIPYTSGTTGRPKGVMVPHRSRILSLFGMAVEYGCYSPDDRFLAIAPMCHGAGMVFGLATLFFGGYTEIMDSFDPEAVIAKFKDERITGFFGVPTHFHAMMSLEQSYLDAKRSDTLHTIISNAAPLPQTMKERLVEHFGEVLHESYGSTEACIVSNLRPPDQLRKQQCVGQPFTSTLIRILDDDGKECAPDQVGELFSMSPYLFNGYWQRPEETEDAFKDGWVTVGDLARRDSEGHIYIVDRKKDMVITGGINVYPREVEEVLLQHPEISDVAVVGRPDEKWGEKLKAFVVRGSGATLDEEAVIAFCDGRISGIKTPKEVEFIDVIPRNATGKVQKTRLRDT